MPHCEETLTYLALSVRRYIIIDSTQQHRLSFFCSPVTPAGQSSARKPVASALSTAGEKYSEFQIVRTKVAEKHLKIKFPRLDSRLIEPDRAILLPSARLKFQC